MKKKEKKNIKNNNNIEKNQSWVSLTVSSSVLNTHKVISYLSKWFIMLISF